MEAKEHRCPEMRYDDRPLPEWMHLRITERVLDAIAAPGIRFQLEIKHCPFCGVKLDGEGL